MKFNPIDKDGFTFMITTLWEKIKPLVPTKTSQLENDENFIKGTDIEFYVDEDGILTVIYDDGID